MIQLRKSDERGHFNHGWLNTYHSFSFARYLDRNFMGFRSLRVLNEDFVEPHHGFDLHPHENMEIISYIVKGEITHEDSLHNRKNISAGNVQYINAGTGVEHSEFNHSEIPLHLIQIWILPKKMGLPPRYDEKFFKESDKKNQLKLVAGNLSDPSAIRLEQDVNIYASLLDKNKTIDAKLKTGRFGYLHLILGKIDLNSTLLSPGDAVYLKEENEIKIKALEPSEFLFFDLA